MMGNRAGDFTQPVQAAIKPQNNTQFTVYVLSSYSIVNKTELQSKQTQLPENKTKTQQPYTLLKERSKKDNIYIH